jgi:hypothetical protein
MKKTIAIVAVTALFSCTGADQSESVNLPGGPAGAVLEAAAEESRTENSHKKYEVKSGIVTFETVMEMGNTKINSRKILYFDDYGIKESEEEYKTDASWKEVLESRNFVKDGYRYNCSFSYKNGAKTKAMGYGVAPVFNMEEAATMKENNYKELPEEEVCGKPCKGFSMKTASGDIKMNGWNGITLRTTLDNPSMKMRSETKAVKIEENVAIPEDKFMVPEGIAMQEM